MLTAVGCLVIFLLMACLMYARRISALLALPMMAVSIALVGGIPAGEILDQVIGAGSLKLHNAYTTTMFGAMLAELVNRQGIAKALIRWVAEFAGDNPFVLGAVLTTVVALLFSTLGGLGAVIMVGTVVLPVMLSIGIGNVTAGALYLFGISLGGMFNLSNWQLYIDVLNIDRQEIIAFVLPFACIMGTLVLAFLAVELRRLRNLGYLVVALAVMACGLGLLGRFPGPGVGEPVDSINKLWLLAGGAALPAVILYAVIRHWRGDKSLPAVALATPFVPLVLVLGLGWEIIPAFVAGIAFGVFVTWKHDSVAILTRSILEGVNTVMPAVILMIGIGMLLAAVMHPAVSQAMAPLLAAVVPTKPVPYVIVFTILAPLSLYRGPLSLWGMGSGLVKLIEGTTRLTSQAIMGMLMSVGQIQGVCDPTNTHNIWIATYLGTDTQRLLRATIPYVWVGVLAGLCLAVAKGYLAQ